MLFRSPGGGRRHRSGRTPGGSSHHTRNTRRGSAHNDLDRENGKYKDLIVIGFDSGKVLNNAVRSGYFYGAVAQDPFTMGYEALMMAVNVLQGGEAEDIVIPAVWFDASNMDDPEISRILYD